MSDSDEESRPCKQSPQVIDDNAGLHPLFWDALPENAEQDPTWQALEAINEESTPEERANTFKTNGNNKLKIGIKSNNKLYLREAIELYCKGLDICCTDNSINSVLLSNRAHVHSLLGNWRKCLEDSLDSKNLDPSNIKAYFRGAKAALHLLNFSLCIQLCSEGLKLDSKATEFSVMSEEAQKKAAEDLRQKLQLQAKIEAEEASARQLTDTILSRNWKVTLPQVRTDNRARPVMDESQLMYWPVVIMYPETMQQDTIEEFCEEDTIEAHLDAMFDPSSPPLEWDVEKKYKRDAIELYYLSYAGKPLGREDLLIAMQGKWPETTKDTAPQRYGEKAAKWVRIDQSLSLGALLSRDDFIIPGVPLLFAVVKGSEYQTRFLSQKGRP